jgi:hypothetical protein
MNPTGITTAIAFLVVIAPGFILESLFQKRRPQPTESGFAETNRVVLASLAFSGASVSLIATALRVFHSSWYDQISKWVLTGHAPKHLGLGSIYVLLVAEFFLAALLALSWDRIVGRRRLGPKVIEPDSAWRKYLSHLDNTRGVIATVTLTDGRVLRGPVIAFTPHDPWADRELVLAAPIMVSTTSGIWARIIEHFVVIPSSSIVTVGVSLVPPGALPKP